MSKSEYEWTQPVSELDKETRILRAAVEAMHARIEKLEEQATLSLFVPKPIDEAAIRRDERERWAKHWGERCDERHRWAAIAVADKSYSRAAEHEAEARAYYNVAVGMDKAKETP